MINDQDRNDAYERAVRTAIQSKKAAGKGEVMVLDIGAGSGLLSMLAARAGRR
jgi:type II protein arginine methyltransferase